MLNSFRRYATVLPTAASLLVALVTLLPLVPVRANFYGDWHNHQWSIAYYGAYLRAHWWVPTHYDTGLVAGMAAPVFYGSAAYSLLGLAATVISPSVVVRLAAAMLLGAQFMAVAAAARRLGAAPFLARTLGWLVVWATYLLTNLYNRGALTEFIATSLLTCALGLLVIAVRAESERDVCRSTSALMFCLTVAAGTHPITALLAMPFFLVVGVEAWCSPIAQTAAKWRVFRWIAAWSVPSVAILAAWLYATFTFARYLRIRSVIPTVVVFAADLDHWRTRFSLLPFDPRVLPGIPLADVSTPYLDTQINMPLLILCAVMAASAVTADPSWARLRRVLTALALPAVLFGFFTWISLSAAAYAYLPRASVLIQFAYRAVTYENLSLLLAVFALLVVQGSSRPPRQRASRLLQVCAVGCLVLAAGGLAVKYQHVKAIRTMDGRSEWLVSPAARRSTADLPRQYYGVRDYTTPRLYEPVDARGGELRTVNFPVGSMESFGEPAPIRLSLQQSEWVGTNVLAFPWNRLTLDGHTLPPACVRSHGPEDLRLAVLVPSGSHVLATQFTPDRWWRVLHPLSVATLFAWALFLAVSCASCLLRRRP
jgi:hypothetical protein